MTDIQWNYPAPVWYQAIKDSLVCGRNLSKTEIAVTSITIKFNG
ncbi:hypothetical protein Cflav_PD0129 [Pedosphaera parvula Ellin514]|uniref:Uncharacterized protein n=1 Tax=Pedosphaera parvula (strain Ellin514) TaxID=320771 RepID=B9XSK3_PEDPL|nr:hypothetical protein Cflav_PD0129 [Pedosphaera parvula Ellin514]